MSIIPGGGGGGGNVEIKKSRHTFFKDLRVLFGQQCKEPMINNCRQRSYIAVIAFTAEIILNKSLLINLREWYSEFLPPTNKVARR